MVHKEHKKRIQKCLAAAFWLLLWQLCAFFIHSDILIASPLVTLQTLCRLAVTASFWLTACTSLLRIFSGFLLGTVLAALLAWGSSRLSGLRILLSPLVTVIRTVPVASFIILALLWVSGRQLSTLISFLMVFPVVYTGTLSGFDSADPQLLEMSSLFRFSVWKRLYTIDIPAALPSFTASCRTAVGLAFKSGVAAEVIGLPEGTIGEQLYEAKIFISTGELFAWTVVLVLLALLCEKLIVFLLKRCCREVGL